MKQINFMLHSAVRLLTSSTFFGQFQEKIIFRISKFANLISKIKILIFCIYPKNFFPQKKISYPPAVVTVKYQLKYTLIRWKKMIKANTVGKRKWWCWLHDYCNMLERAYWYDLLGIVLVYNGTVSKILSMTSSRTV